MNRLQDKIAVVFGGTGGIGGALCDGFVEEGAIVIPTSRNKETVTQTVAQLASKSNPYADTICCDITSEEEIEALCAYVIDRYSRIDIMACVSGAYLKKPARDITRSQWQAVIDVNLTGTFLTNRIAGNYMIDQGAGSIINIGSLGSFVALSDTAPYCASKAGVIMLSRCLACEWADKGVRVNTIIPGVFPTNLNKTALSDQVRVANIIRRTPQKRLGSLQELKGAAIYLASDEASFVTGIELPVDGGFLAHSGF